jgi:type I restriction enzyme S subunit
MGNYQAYEKYKDSGVEWLGEIPEHWEVKKLKHLVTKVGSGVTPKGGSSIYQLEGIPLLRSQNIHFDGLRLEDVAYISEEIHQEMSNSAVSNGDVLLNITGGSIGRCFYIDDSLGDANVNQHVCIIRPNKNLSTLFLYFFFRSSLGQKQIDIEQTGSGREGLNFVALKNFIFPQISLDEQESIANFLDRKTKQIDDLIAKKEALLAKLDEKRSAIISHAVTKGLDPTVPMKDSGIEWLGSIPKHWEVLRVKHLTKILRGKFSHRPRNDPKLYDGEYAFIQTGDVANANKFIIEYSQTLNEEGYAVSKEFPSGTLVMTIAANIGDMAILNFNACFPDSIVGFLSSNKTSILFLYYLFTSMRKQFLSTAVLNTQLNLNVERISNLFTVIAPIDEQVKIIDFLDQQITNIDQQKAKVQEAIERLKEYRTALITNAVTGKIDVRQVSLN